MGSLNSFEKHIGLNVNSRPFWNVTVVVATDETLWPLILYDALKVIQCVALLPFFSKIFIVLFEVQICNFSTLHEIVRSKLNGRYLLVDHILSFKT